MDKEIARMVADFKRMDLMLKVFPRIGKAEREWFIKRLWADHAALLTQERKRKGGRGK